MGPNVGKCKAPPAECSGRGRDENNVHIIKKELYYAREGIQNCRLVEI